MIELARELRAEVEDTAARLRSMPEAEAGRDAGAGRWTRKEILGHLIDSAANNHQRFVRARIADPYVGPGYEQDFWVSVHRYRERPWSELVELWVALNRHVATTIETLPAERLGTPCIIADLEPRPLEWWIRDYLRHLRHHVEQIVGGRMGAT